MKQELELNDIADELLIINKTTIERLFQEENKEIIVLYMFYYKTAKWQKHNPIKANDEYVKKSLHWGIDKVSRLKKRLKEMELIKVEKRANEKGQVMGWFVKLNYYKTTIPETTIPTLPELVSQETNTINNNNINTNNNINNNIKRKNDIEDIINYLNEVCGTKYRTNSQSTLRHINARFNEGFTYADFINVIINKSEEWLGTDMEKYLTPDTLFGTKFEKYLNQGGRK